MTHVFNLTATGWEKVLCHGDMVEADTIEADFLFHVSTVMNWTRRTFFNHMNKCIKDDVFYMFDGQDEYVRSCRSIVAHFDEIMAQCIRAGWVTHE